MPPDTKLVWCVIAAFIEPMLLLRTEKLPEGKEWRYELKLDGYPKRASSALMVHRVMPDY